MRKHLIIRAMKKIHGLTSEFYIYHELFTTPMYVKSGMQGLPFPRKYIWAGKKTGADKGLYNSIIGGIFLFTALFAFWQLWETSSSDHGYDGNAKIVLL